jgi:hypothetical protein
LHAFDEGEHEIEPPLVHFPTLRSHIGKLSEQPIQRVYVCGAEFFHEKNLVNRGLRRMVRGDVNRAISRSDNLDSRRGRPMLLARLGLTVCQCAGNAFGVSIRRYAGLTV